MRRLSAAAQEAIDEIARRSGFSAGAVSSMLESILAGHGRMAQFDHPEFGGSGQWMRGGMTMISDMFNATLKARVVRLCDDLSQLIADRADIGAERLEPRSDEGSGAASAGWWPADLGRPNSAGAQNETRYAYFAAGRRLAIAAGGRITVYDTLDHRIAGVAQQQPGRGSLTFSSQHGAVDVATLPVVSGAGERVSSPGEPVSGLGQAPASSNDMVGTNDIVATIERLAELHRKGILSEAEFAAKKTELLSRL